MLCQLRFVFFSGLLSALLYTLLYALLHALLRFKSSLRPRGVTEYNHAPESQRCFKKREQIGEVTIEAKLYGIQYM